jgi:hypothetical protein
MSRCTGRTTAKYTTAARSTKLMQRLQEDPVGERDAGQDEAAAADVARRSGDDADQRCDERGHEAGDHRPERRADDDRDSQVDDVAAQQELLEAVHWPSLSRPGAAR